MGFEDLAAQLAVFAAAGLATGFFSGLFGIGGGIVRIPLFLYLLPRFGVAQPVLMHIAIGTSIALVIPSALVATRKQYRLGNLDWSFYRTWAIGILIGDLIGMMILPFLSTDVLKGIFAGFLLLIGCYVGLVKDTVVVSSQPPRGVAKLGISGAIGLFSALTGTGGGAFTTPALKAYSFSMKQAIATASATGLVIGVVGTAAVLVQGWSVPGRPPSALGYVDGLVFLSMLPTTLIGASWGATASNRLNKTLLKRIYTVLLFVVAADMIWKLLDQADNAQAWRN